MTPDKVEIVPVTHSRQVTLSWPIIYTTSNDQIRQRYIKPDAYVAHLIGHEGKGSILSYIKKKGWAVSSIKDFFNKIRLLPVEIL